MALFCRCGSIIINDRCTNKSCTLKSASGQAVPKPKAARQTKSTVTRPKKSSKCITYKLEDLEKMNPKD